jgi:hypothetical protein
MGCQPKCEEVLRELIGANDPVCSDPRKVITDHENITLVGKGLQLRLLTGGLFCLSLNGRRWLVWLESRQPRPLRLTPVQTMNAQYSLNDK